MTSLRRQRIEISRVDTFSDEDDSAGSDQSADEATAKREVQAALKEQGAVSVSFCAVGSVSPNALRAIAGSIRSLGSAD